MLVLNAGLETISFGHNQNSRNKKEGGYYKLLPGEQMDIPETAREQIYNSLSGEGLKGLVILDYGTDVGVEKVKGLTNYTKNLNTALTRELQRTLELTQVGVSYSVDRPEVVAIKERIAKAEEALKQLGSNFTPDDSESKHILEQTQEAKNGNILRTTEQSEKESGRSDRLKSK